MLVKQFAAEQIQKDTLQINPSTTGLLLVNMILFINIIHYNGNILVWN